MPNAVISGCSTGLGEAMAKSLLEADFRVFGGSRQGSEISHPSFRDIELDIRDENSVMNFYNQVEEEVDGIHLIINNAGICEMASIFESGPEQFINHFSTNTLGTFHFLKYAEDFLIENETHIVSILSTAAKVAYPNVAAYTSSKFAMKGLLETAKKEWSDLGLRFTNLYPGAIDTPLWDKMNPTFSREKMLTIDEFIHVFEMIAFSPPMVQFPDVTFLHKDGFLE